MWYPVMAHATRAVDLQASETKEEGVSAEKVEDWWNRVRREKE